MEKQRPPRQVILSLLACLAIGAWAPPPAVGAAAVDPAVVRDALQVAATRLNLTPEQRAQLKPVFEESAQKLKAIREAHAGDSSRAARRAMFREARPVQKEFEGKVQAVLDESQQAEWEKMRNEARARLAEQRKGGGGPE